VSVGCIVVAAGRGERLGAGPKAFVVLEGLTLVAWACAGLEAAGVDQVVAVLPAGRSGAEPAGLPAHVERVAGGQSRQQSVSAGLAALRSDVDVVLVHDAARPLAPVSVFAAVIAAVRAGHRAVVPAVPVTDTLRLAHPGPAEVAVHRDRLVAVQTPQGFDRNTLVRAHTHVPPGSSATDDAGLAEFVGATVHVVPGHEESFKITRPLDLLLARAVVSERRWVGP